MPPNPYQPPGTEQDQEKPVSGVGKVAAICMAAVLAIVFAGAALAASGACFVYLPGALKLTGIVPWFVLWKFIGHTWIEAGCAAAMACVVTYALVTFLVAHSALF